MIAGSPATVRDQLMDAVKKLRVGNLMVLLHIGSMPHELTLKNIELFCARSRCRISATCGTNSWDNKWWPTALREKEMARKASNGSAHQAAQAAK